MAKLFPLSFRPDTDKLTQSDPFITKKLKCFMIEKKIRYIVNDKICSPSVES